MLYYLFSIIVVTLIFWMLYKFKITFFCPICAGVVITWVGGLIALYSDVSWANPLIIAILMAMSIGALADKYGSQLGLIWKTLLVLLGLPAIYLFVEGSLWQGLGLIGLLMVITKFSRNNRNHVRHDRGDLFKDCC